MTASTAISSVAPYQIPNPSELPKSRLNWQVDPERAVLLVHDMQRYFVSAYRPGTEPITTVVPNIARLCAQARSAGIPVVFSAQPGDQTSQQRRLLADLWGPGLRALPEDEDIIDELRPAPSDARLTKWRYSAFQRTDLSQWMRDWGRDQLLVTGIYAHLGCLVTACEAFMQDIQPFLLADAVADFSADDHHMALRYTSTGCGVVLTTESLLDTLAGVQHELDPAQVRADLLAVLDAEEQEISDDDNLDELGLDSIRLMHLVEQWRTRGAEVNFTQLVGVSTLRELQRNLTGS